MSEFSILSLIRSTLRDPSLGVAPDEGQAEQRRSRALANAQPSGLPLRGNVIPWSALAPRAETRLTGPGPGATSVRSIVLDVLGGAESILGELGVRFQPLGAGDHNLVALHDSAVAGFVKGEGGTLDPWTSDMVDGVSSFDWCDIASRVDVSRRLLIQSPGVEDRLRELLRNGVVEAMEGGVIAGGGAHEPLGLIDSRWGCPVEEWASAVPAHGEACATVRARAVAMKQKLDRFAWLASTADFDAYMAADGRSAGEPLVRELDGGRFSMAGRPLYFTNYLPAGKTVLGAFDHLTVGLYGSPSIVTNPYLDDYSKSRISIYQAVGSAVGRPEAFAICGAA
jgi:HK97 family phage major capsid protein